MDDDENELCCFGTPLDPIEEDETVPTKKITLADQIATDSNGRRRFHGAFTGGFSAGYWNTVGSRDGWTPSEFKSSRVEKAAHRSQLPTDFMDEEDMGEYGIAPQRIQTTDDFGPSSNQSKNKRKLVNDQLEPIPGVPVLELLLESCHDKAAIRLLKRMDKKYVKRKEEEKNAAQECEEEVNAEEENNIETTESVIDSNEMVGVKVYQCDMGPIARVTNNDDEYNGDSDSDTEYDQLVFYDDDDEFDKMANNMKTNRFGLNYVGLNKGDFFSIIGAEGPQRYQNNSLSTFTMTDQHNKSVTIKGHAFGVGAFEEDDYDIYGRDDMSKYDFRLDQKLDDRSTKTALAKANHFIDGFSKLSVRPKQNVKQMFKVELPFGFEPRNWLKRKSRFGPENPVTKDVVGRHDLAPSQRGDILGEKPSTSKLNETNLLELNVDAKLMEARLKSVNFVSSSNNEIPGIEDQQKLKKPSQESAANFIIPETIPFISDRFTSSQIEKESDLPPPKIVEEKLQIIKEPQKIIRTKSTWLPSQLFCYKMNIEAAVGAKPDKPNAFSLFECINIGNDSKRKNQLEFTGSLHKDLRDTKDNLETNAGLNHQRPPKIPTRETLISPTAETEATCIIKKPEVSVIVKRVEKPKTELELKIIETQNEHPSTKKDIFRAIFDSDSENEDTTESEPIVEKVADFLVKPSTSASASASTSTSSSSVPMYAMLPDETFMPKSAKELNILRNTSPPRGIFKSLMENSRITSKPPIEKEKEDQVLSKNVETESDVNMYGPSLPPSKITESTSAIASKPKQIVISSSSSDDEWIEKSSHKRKKSKKEKSHKKDKHKRSKKHKKKDKKEKR